MRHFPDKKVHITNELIHNPEVNDKLADMGVQFIEKKADEGGVGEIKDFTTIEEGDVVILPAFGASFEEMDFFDKKVSYGDSALFVSLLLFLKTNASRHPPLVYVFVAPPPPLSLPLSRARPSRTWTWWTRPAPGYPRYGTRWTRIRRRD